MFLASRFCASVFFCYQSSLEQNCFRITDERWCFGWRSLTSCWQLSFLWGHQLTHSTLLFLCTPCFPGSFLVGFLLWQNLILTENCFPVPAYYLKADVQDKAQDRLSKIGKVFVSQRRRVGSQTPAWASRGQVECQDTTLSKYKSIGFLSREL